MRVTVTWQHFSTGSVASGDTYPRYSDNNSDSKTASESDASENRSASATPVTDGGLSSLFFWTEDNKPAHRSAASTSSESKPARAAEKATEPAKKKSASSATKKKPASEEKKAKADEKPASKEKKSASAVRIPDPKKPREIELADPVATKASLVRPTDSMPAATRTTASAGDSLPVNKTAEQIQ
jgi:hypothetical protein